MAPGLLLASISQEKEARGGEGKEKEKEEEEDEEELQVCMCKSVNVHEIFSSVFFIHTHDSSPFVFLPPFPPSKKNYFSFNPSPSQINMGAQEPQKCHV